MTSEKRTVSVGCDVPSVVNSLKACRSWIVRVCLPSAYNYMLIISVMLSYHDASVGVFICILAALAVFSCSLVLCHVFVFLPVSSVLQDVFGFFCGRSFQAFLTFPVFLSAAQPNLPVESVVSSRIPLR